MQDCTVAAAVECWENNKSFILVSLAKTTTSTEIVYEIFSVLGTCKMEERSRMVVLLVGKPPEICTIILLGLASPEKWEKERKGGGRGNRNKQVNRAGILLYEQLNLGSSCQLPKSWPQPTSWLDLVCYQLLLPTAHDYRWGLGYRSTSKLKTLLCLALSLLQWTDTASLLQPLPQFPLSISCSPLRSLVNKIPRCLNCSTWGSKCTLFRLRIMGLDLGVLIVRSWRPPPWWS